MKRALFIAYHFPPLAGGGTFRSLKFVKYLPEFGWLPTVISTKTSNYWAYDPGLLDEIPRDVEVIRTTEIDPFYLQWLLSKMSAPALYDIIRDRYLMPDEKIGWVPSALRQAKRQLRQRHYDLVFSSSPTPCAHRIAMQLKRRFRLPWVADYRDQWTTNPEYPYKNTRRALRESALENKMNSLADKIISVTQGNLDDLYRQRVPATKLALIYNGFDGDIQASGAPEKSDKLVISYTGTFYGDRNPHNLLKALCRLLREQPMIGDELKILFYGKSDFDIPGFRRANHLEKMVEWQASVPLHELTPVYASSHVFLLIIPENEPNILTSKLFDYLRFQKPVLALVPDGEARHILERSGLGYFAPPDSVDLIKAQLLRIYQQWKSGQLNPAPNSTYIEQFHRKNLTRQLVEIFESLL